MELRSHMISERTAPADHIIADRGAAGICGCGPLRDHVASQLHDHRWIAPAPRRPRSRSNTQLNRPSTDYATALGREETVFRTRTTEMGVVSREATSPPVSTSSAYRGCRS